MADTVAPRPIIAQLVATMRALAGAHPKPRHDLLYASASLS